MWFLHLKGVRPDIQKLADLDIYDISVHVYHIGNCNGDHIEFNRAEPFSSFVLSFNVLYMMKMLTAVSTYTSHNGVLIQNNAKIMTIIDIQCSMYLELIFQGTQGKIKGKGRVKMSTTSLCQTLQKIKKIQLKIWTF